LKKISFNYPIKVWLTTATVAPFFTLLVDKICTLGVIQNYEVGTSEFLLLSVLIGLAFSVPALIIFSFLTILLNNIGLNYRLTKLALTTIAIVLTFLTIYFISSYKDHTMWTLFVCYSTTISTTILLFSLNKE